MFMGSSVWSDEEPDFQMRTIFMRMDKIGKSLWSSRLQAKPCDISL